LEKGLKIPLSGTLRGNPRFSYLVLPLKRIFLVADATFSYLTTKVVMLLHGCRSQGGSAVIGEPTSAANPPFHSFGLMAQTKINAPGSAPLNVSKQAINYLVRSITFYLH
jgi:hypothetical protein